MKRILNLTVLALVLLLGTLPVMATERPFGLNGNRVATFGLGGVGELLGAD